MATSWTRTAVCDVSTCSATYTADIGDPAPNGWEHIAGRSAKTWGSGSSPRTYCPTHANPAGCRCHVINRGGLVHRGQCIGDPEALAVLAEIAGGDQS